MTSNDTVGQTETNADTDADQIDQGAEVLPEGTEVPMDDTSADHDQVDDGQVDDGQVDEDQDDDGDQNDDTDNDQVGGRRNREAQYRHERNEARRERDELRGQLDTLHRQMVTDIATGAGLPEVELLESAGHELASFITDEGEVDKIKVIEATTETMRRYSIQRGGLTPNAQQGMYHAPVSSSGVAGVIKEALGR